MTHASRVPQPPVILGCIADDLTGATDVAGMLARQGMRTVLMVGPPAATAPPPETEAVVVALKSRTCPPAEAVAMSRAALAWLRGAGARQILFKYCSTFDSTDAGNIGPVADALLDDLGADFTIACPAFPENGRTIYQGHLFVGGQLLSESSMRSHPLTPMTDADLVRVLGRQTRHAVGLVPHAVVSRGPEPIRDAMAALQASGHRYAIVDAVEDRHLRDIGEAVAGLPLVTGGSGIALGLPASFRRQGLLGDAAGAAGLPDIEGHAAVIAGSCSPATLGQIEHMRASHPSLAIDALAIASGCDVAADALAWARGRLGREPVLIYASAPPEEVRRVQQRLGRAEAGALVEDSLAAIAHGLVSMGVRRLIVAGGETSGAVMARLGIASLQIGPQIDPGVPWTASLDEPRLLIALKSGNFGARDFFTRAFGMLP